MTAATELEPSENCTVSSAVNEPDVVGANSTSIEQVLPLPTVAPLQPSLPMVKSPLGVSCTDDTLMVEVPPTTWAVAIRRPASMMVGANSSGLGCTVGCTVVVVVVVTVLLDPLPELPPELPPELDPPLDPELNTGVLPEPPLPLDGKPLLFTTAPPSIVPSPGSGTPGLSAPSSVSPGITKLPGTVVVGPVVVVDSVVSVGSVVSVDGVSVVVVVVVGGGGGSTETACTHTCGSVWKRASVVRSLRAGASKVTERLPTPAESALAMLAPVDGTSAATSAPTEVATSESSELAKRVSSSERSSCTAPSR